MNDRGRVVMIAGAGSSTRLVFNALRRAIDVPRVIMEEPMPTKQFLRRRVEKLGVRIVAGQLLFKALVEPALRLRAKERTRGIKRELDLDDTEIPASAITRITSINSPEAIKHLCALDPAVVVVNGTRIIAKKVLEAVRAPFINMHAGITPLYRGVHGGYWALAQGDPHHCGVTVHMVDAGIDTGGIIYQALITPTSRDSYATYPLLQTAAGLPLLVDAVKAALEGSLKQKPAPAGTSRLWSHPTLGQYLRARWVHGTR